MAKLLFMGEVCRGLQFDSIEDWGRLYSAAGLVDVQVETGPFDMLMTGTEPAAASKA